MLDQTIDLDHTVQALADCGRRTLAGRPASGSAPVGELAESEAVPLVSGVQHVEVLEACG